MRACRRSRLIVLTGDAPFPRPPSPASRRTSALVAREAPDVRQRRVAQLVPGAKHITNADSGHNIMLDNAALVSESIVEVGAAVREGRTSPSR